MSNKSGMENLSSTNGGSSSEQPLSVGEKIGYGLGDTASNFYWKLFENFQLYFYTEVFGITAAAAATMFFVTKLWDGINDPMVGFLSDRTRTAWGRFRPYLLWMAIPFAATGILTFYTPDLSPNGKLIYAYVTYTLVFMAYTAINIPYGALLGVISPNSIERTSVSTYRFVLAFFGGLIVQVCTLPLVLYIGGTRWVFTDDSLQSLRLVTDRQTGFFWTVVIYAVAAAILFVITFATTRERVQPVREKNADFYDDLKNLLSNRPWIVLLFVGLFQILSDWTRGSAVGYYFNYYLGIENFGWFFGSATIAGILGMLLTKPLTQAFGKKNLLIWMNIAKAILTAAFFLLSKDQIQLIYGINILSAFVTGPIPILLWAMYADVADYSEYQNNRRATGLVFAAATFSQKMGGALGAAVPGWCLAYIGFVERVDNKMQEQSAETINGIIVMMSLLPAVFLSGAVIAMFYYTLTEPVMKNIEAELKRRKEEVLPKTSHPPDQDSGEN